MPAPARPGNSFSRDRGEKKAAEIPFFPVYRGDYRVFVGGACYTGWLTGADVDFFFILCRAEVNGIEFFLVLLRGECLLRAVFVKVCFDRGRSQVLLVLTFIFKSEECIVLVLSVISDHYKIN